MKVYRGTVVHATKQEACLVLEDHLLAVDNGKVITVEVCNVM